MGEHPPPPDDAFRRLQRTLARRRITAIDPRLRVELVLLSGLIAGFAFWQCRVFLDSLIRSHGTATGVLGILSIWAALALIGGSLAGSRYARELRRHADRPPWLSLPLEPAAVTRHLTWEAELVALWVVPPVPGVLAATLGLVPLPWVVALSVAFVAMLWGSSRLGCSVAGWLAVESTEPRPGVPPLVRALAAVPHPARPGPRRTVRWRTQRLWLALWSKDLLLSRRRTGSRRRLWVPLALAILSILSWALPVSPPYARLIAFTLALVSAATFGEWLIELSGEDPFPILKSLPVDVGAVWAARAAWSMMITIGVVAVHAVAARPLEPPALRLFLAWTGGATMLITLLAVNYGTTLYPRAEAAQRIYSLALGLAVVVSWILPLMGWVALLTAIVHSALRIPRWRRLEITP